MKISDLGFHMIIFNITIIVKCFFKKTLTMIVVAVNSVFAV